MITRRPSGSLDEPRLCELSLHGHRVAYRITAETGWSVNMASRRDALALCDQSQGRLTSAVTSLRDLDRLVDCINEIAAMEPPKTEAPKPDAAAPVKKG